MSQFFLGSSYEFFLLGDKQDTQELKRYLQAKQYLKLSENAQVLNDRDQLFFVIAPCDFNDMYNAKIVMRSFSKIKNPHCIKIIYSIGHGSVKVCDYIFAHQLNISTIVHGSQKDQRLNDYVKRIAFSQKNSILIKTISDDIEAAIKTKNYNDLNRIKYKLLSMNNAKESPQVLRLLALISQHKQQYKKGFYYLKKLLENDPQDVFSANLAASSFCRSHKDCEGLLFLNKYSSFSSYELELEQDLKILDLFSGLNFSSDLMNFLSLRASMAKKEKLLQEAIYYYQLCVKGCVNNKLLKGRFLYELGQIFLQRKEFSRAIEAFSDSEKLCGKKLSQAHFDRAYAVNIMLKNKPHGKKIINNSKIQKNNSSATPFDNQVDELEIEYSNKS